METPFVALAPFVRFCPRVLTLGIRATMGDYPPEERSLLRSARKVLFPTPRFSYLFHALGVPTFPSHASYSFLHSRVSQQILFEYLGWPHPRTRIYFGARQKQNILMDFRLPLVAMGPRPGVDGSHRVEDRDALERLKVRYNPLIIQEAVAWEKIERFLCVSFQCLGDDGSSEPREASLRLARMTGLDDVVMEWGYRGGTWQQTAILRPPAVWRSASVAIDRHRYICRLICEGRL